MKQKQYYVNASSTASSPDGKSWESAFKDLQSAVDAAASTGGGEIWVAAGTYTATADPVLTMKENVALYGGFVGTETAINQRDWKNHVTIIDGEKKRRCVFGANNARLDGFTIARGFATKDGGGMYNWHSSPTVTNCTFTENEADYGGGMCNWYSSPTVINCSFTQNTAKHHGSGMYNDESTPSVTNCTFAGNVAKHYGGGMYNYDSSPTVRNCTFTENEADYGGGMCNWHSSPTVTNCTFTENEADYDGGMHNLYSSPTVRNCTFTGNTADEGGHWPKETHK